MKKLLHWVQGWVQPPLIRWVHYWYGKPDDATIQVFFYRCERCRGVVSWNMIRAGGCCPGARIGPAVLTFLEEVKILFMVWQGHIREDRHA